MFGLRKTLGSVIVVVLFLALASLATFFYNTDQKKQEEIANSDLAQRGQIALGALVGASESIVDVNLQKNVGPGKTMIDYIRKIDWKSLAQGTTIEEKDIDPSDGDSGDLEETDANNDTPGFWAKFADLVKKEWSDNQKEENAQPEAEEEMTVDQSEDNFFSYQKTEIGAEIIFKAKSGQDYKLPLPFQFLTRF
jgi:hypothetical protein